MALGNIASIIRLHREERPDAVAIIEGEVRHSWRSLDEISSRIANALLAAGVGAGDRIARIEKNGVDYFHLVLAAAKINATLVDVNWRLAPPEKLHVVNDSKSKLLFIGEEFLGELAQSFNAIYHRHPILQEEDVEIRNARLATMEVFVQGLTVLSDHHGDE